MLAAAASALTTLGLEEERQTNSPDKRFPVPRLPTEIEALDGLQQLSPCRQVNVKFPQRLMLMLSDPRFDKTISWLPNGFAFVVFQPNNLATGIRLPSGETIRFSSFVRKLLRWYVFRINLFYPYSMLIFGGWHMECIQGLSKNC
jgi:hypothetical protein